VIITGHTLKASLCNSFPRFSRFLFSWLVILLSYRTPPDSPQVRFPLVPL